VREPRAGGLQDPCRGRLTRRAREAGGLLCLVAALLVLAPAQAGAQSGEAPQIPARAWLLLDTGDGARLAAHDAGSSLAIASATKLMTAYVALRRLPTNSEVAAAPYSPIPGESLLGLEAGERMSVRDLLYGLLMASGNDAAVTLADGVAGSTDAFVAQMNRAARRLGLRDTSYENPIGLDGPGNYSSARDLAHLTLTLRRDELFRRIVDTPQITLESGNQPRTIMNRNDLLSSHPWINGVKTGYTPEAGNVLVATGTRKGVTLLSVVMGAPSIASRDSSTLTLLDYGFSLYRREVAVRPGERLGSASVANADTRLALRAKGGVRATVRSGQEIDIAVRAPSSVEAPILRGQRVGTATATLAGQPVGRVALVAARTVKPTPDDSLVATVDEGIPGPRAVVWLIGAGLVAIVVLIVAALAGRRPGRGAAVL
jgi:serine-type D-Ala-D-Ala carboxypeptidase (penicillin-binding protein 5/6)